MIRLTTSKASRSGRRATGGRRERPVSKGFTLVELLVVIVVLAILIGLLLPAINGALKTARNAAVSAEINQLAQALANFKAKYGDYPPSRFLCVENGNYLPFLSETTIALNTSGLDPTSIGAGDIFVSQLAQRSVAALRKFWPRLTTTSALPGNTWYDFNGNGQVDAPYILHGHECLVFFLGGVPLLDPTSGTHGLTGFGKDPTNPFTNMIVGNTMYNANRQEAFYQFNPGRLFLDPQTKSQIPAYYDSLNSGPPMGAGQLNFYAYFNAYGNNNYDPNDVNFLVESDVMGNAPIELEFKLPFPTNHPSSASYGSGAISAAPNPYTSSSTQPATGSVIYQNPQTFQIISAGLDGLYGVGGQYVSNSQSASGEPLPFDPNSTFYGGSYGKETDGSIRQREFDNLTNFKSGTLD